MINIIKFFKNIFKPKAKIFRCPKCIKPDGYGNNNWMIIHKRHWWNRWRYLSNGVWPLLFTKEEAEKIIKLNFKN